MGWKYRGKLLGETVILPSLLELILEYIVYALNIVVRRRAMIVAHGNSGWLLLPLLTSLTSSATSNQITIRNQTGNLTGNLARNQIGYLMRDHVTNLERSQTGNLVRKLSGMQVGNQKNNHTFDLTGSHEIDNQVYCL